MKKTKILSACAFALSGILASSGFFAGSVRAAISESAAKNAALQMTATLENSTTELQFNYAENINDGRGITFGAIGFCTGTYDGNKLVKHYTDLNPDNNLAKYIPEVDAIDAGPHNAAGGDGNPSTAGLSGFIEAVRGNDDPLFRQAQIDMLDELYWNPAVRMANSIGAQYNLTLAFIYDMSVRQGPDGAQSIINKAKSALGGTPATGVDETAFLNKMISLRDSVLRSEGLGDVDRNDGFKQVLSSGNTDLNTPFTFTAYGDTFTIKGGVYGGGGGNTATKYTLTVNQGNGSGSYAAGAKVAINANLPSSSDKAFDKWTGDTSYISNAAASQTVVTMPDKAIVLTATYKDAVSEKYVLTVNSGTGDGSYSAGTKISIAADEAPEGKVFDRWTGNIAYVSDVKSATAQVTMPNQDIAVTATYKIESSGSINLPDGTLIKLPESPKIFVIINGEKKWISTPEQFEQMGCRWTDIENVTESILDGLDDIEHNLIRLINDYKVYLVTDGTLRHIPSPQIFLDYGFKWDDIQDVDEPIVSKYKNTYLVRESGTEEVYYLNKNGVRKHIPNEEIFNSYGDKWEDVQVVSKTEMESYPVSNLIRLEGSDDVHLVSENVRKLIPDAATFDRKGFDWNRIVSVNKTEFNWYRDGGKVK